MRYGPDLADLDAIGVQVKKDYTAEQREKAHTLPGTDKFPIEDEADLRNAIRLAGSSSEPREKVRRHIMAQARRLGKTDLIPDEWKSGAPADTEVKRTTTKPWEKPKGERQGSAIGKVEGDDGDEWTIKTIGDLAAAIKRAKKIKDPERQKTVRAHIRKRAAAIKAPNMVPKEWGEQKSAVPARAYVLTDADRALLAAIQHKVLSPHPALRRLRSYYAVGAGRPSWSSVPQLCNRLATKGVPRVLAGPLAVQIAAVATDGPSLEVKTGLTVSSLDEPPTMGELEALYGDDGDDGDDDGGDLDDEFDDEEAALFEGVDFDGVVADVDAVGDDGAKGLWLDAFEVKVMSANPNAARLREYWAHGAGRRKWRPGTKGDFRRLRRQLSKYVKNPRILNGLTANIHKLATGFWPGPGKGPGRHKSAPQSSETKVMIAPDLVEQMRRLRVDDGDELDDDEALARYEELAPRISADVAYEEALASEVPWTLDVDGDLVETDEAGEPVSGLVPSLLDEGLAPWSSSRGTDLMSLVD